MDTIIFTPIYENKHDNEIFMSDNFNFKVRIANGLFKKYYYILHLA